MKFSALLTSAGINIGLCWLMLALYSLLRKQPGNAAVYFGGKRARDQRGGERGPSAFERLVPSPRWMATAWKYPEEQILKTISLDAVVFLRMIVFSMKIFLIAAVVCLPGVLPLNYFGQEMHHKNIASESLDSFSIANIKEKSQWFWVHSVALYIISISACVLLFIEYKNIARMRLAHIKESSPKLSNFTILVRGIPKSNEESFSDSVKRFFTKYHATSYLSHQMIYKTGKVQKLMSITGRACNKFIEFKAAAADQISRLIGYRCCYWRAGDDSFDFDPDHFQLSGNKSDHDCSDLNINKKECSAAFVFFRTRYAALVASQVLQSSNPMLLVTDPAPEPADVYWSNLWLPYWQLWLRRIAILVGSIVFMFLFLPPVTFVQGLTQLDGLQKRLPFLKGILKKTFISELVTGYLPSVILQLFLLIVPPVMMRFSTLEGPVSYSARKKSACYKVLYFTIWNVFFVNVLSGSILYRLNVLSSPKGIPTELARAVPSQGTFFITYVLTSGWASLCSEVMQLFPLLFCSFKRCVLGSVDNPDSVPSFPYHTEVPRVLLFGLLGFTFSVLAPLILPFLLIYFLLGYVVYCNQIVNVYNSKYETGGLMWPIMHNTTVFSLVLAQIIALGVFGLKKSPVASFSTILLIMFTVLFSEYCRQRFYPLFKSFSAQDLIDMDTKDEESGKMEEIHQKLQTAYGQFPEDARETCKDESSGSHNLCEGENSVTKEADSKVDFKELKNDFSHPTLPWLPSSSFGPTFISLTKLVSWNRTKLQHEIC